MSWLIVLLVFLFASFRSNNNIKKYMKVSVIVPAYNEEETVATVVKVIKSVSYVDEVIVVNDGSSDNTVEEAEKAGAIVFSHEKNKGKGEALKTGYLKSDSDIVAFIDADIHNLTPKKVDAIIKPILEGKTDITKTKFARESGRVTELTAKPLLNFFFPEISFEQPLSGQFAAKREVLEKINFEPDYGVDVGIVLDADVQGISIKEVDIGEIEHDMSPLADLHLMANEVVRTIIDRANKYGRVVMIDDIGYLIRMAIVGLSLIILGLFTLFFVRFIPLEVGVLITVFGIAIAVYYLIKVVSKSIGMYKKMPKHNLIKSFIKIHFPVLISAVILLLMLSTFLGAAHIENGAISIEPNSRNLILFSDDTNNTIAVRGPYTVSSALENESNLLRMPSDALQTLGLSYGDTVTINSIPYNVNETKMGELDLLRLPMDVKEYLEVADGDILQNSRLNHIFDGAVVSHNVSSANNTTLFDSFIISDRYNNGSRLDVIVDNVSMGSIGGIFENNSSYSVAVDGHVIGSIDFINNSFENNTFEFNFEGHNYMINVTSNNITTIQHFVNSQEGNFIDFRTIYDVS